MDRQRIQTANAPQAIGPYSQAICTDTLIFVSGQIPLDPATGQLIEGDIQVQTHQVMQNLQAVLAAAGSSLAHVVKTTIFLTDIEEFALVNQLYGEFFASDPPARSTVQVAALPKGARIEIDAVALR